MRQPREKLFSIDDVVVRAGVLQSSRKRIVTTNGCFDLLHRGHVEYLFRARAMGDVLFVGINSDESVRNLKGSERPINNQKDRAYLLASLECVDGVFVFHEDTPEAWLRRLRPHIHVKGDDYRGKKLAEECVTEWGGKLEFVSIVPGFSTTSMIDRMRKGT